jgi:ankyrin repeat protein
VSDTPWKHHSSATSRIELQLKAVHVSVERNHLEAMSILSNSKPRVQNFQHVQNITYNTYSDQNNSEEFAAILAKAFANANISSYMDHSMIQKVVSDVLQDIYQSQQHTVPEYEGSVSAIVNRGARSLTNPMPTPRVTAGYIRTSTASIAKGTSVSLTCALGRQQTLCEYKCDCRCHSSRPPVHRWGNYLLGTLLLGYSGLPYLTPSCSRDHCSGNGRVTVEATYVFPLWFLQYSLSAILVKTSMGGPNLGLFVTKRVNFVLGNVLHASYIGDLAAVKRCVEVDPYCVYYALTHDGRTALAMAMQSSRIDFDLIRFLLQNGASPDAVDDMGNSVMLRTSRRVLFSNAMRNSAAGRELSTLFGTDRYIETLNLSLISKIMVGICPGSVETVLRRGNYSPEELNTIDGFGCTPLGYAVVRLNLNATRLLIEAGVDVNIGAGEESIGALSRTLSFERNETIDEIADMLIEAGADINALDAYGWRPIHWASRSNNVHGIQTLLDLGVDPNTRIGAAECSPCILVAIAAQSLEAVKYLAAHGADINAQNEEDETALASSVIHNSHNCLRFFLDQDINHRAVMRPTGQNLLHLAAQVGDGETMNILSESHTRLAGLSLSTPDGAGLTPQQVFDRRPGNEDLVEPWGRLAKEIDAINSGYTRNRREENSDGERGDTQGDESDDEFHDAPEKLALDNP